MEFLFARSPQAGSRRLKVGVVIPRMANKFPCALGDAHSDCMKQRFIEYTGDDDAQGAVGSEKAFAIDGFPKVSGKALQYAHLNVALPEIWPPQQARRTQRKTRPEGIAYSSHAAFFGRPQQRAKNLRE